MSTEIAKHNHPKTSNKTPSLNHVGLKKDWILIDLDGIILGRVASFVAHRLTGKHRADYTPHIDCGDHVILINSDKIVLTGDKETDKVYYHHTGFPGGIKSITVKATRAKRSQDLVTKAIKRMLGRGPLAYKQMTRLHVYAGSENPHTAQQPKVINFGDLNRKNTEN